ncbi:MAG: hypothetical protein U5L10_04055 [Candidatus Moranbacteria bacterium]|nr:hypothetical protein [Candidatus Moranbacteria bacterium]
MKFKIPYNFSRNTSDMLRNAGYKFITDRKTGKNSYVQNISGGRYPRFHLYLKEEGDNLIFDLHLDQSPVRYAGQTAHKADYDSPEVKDELIRIYQTVKPFLREK